MALTPDERVFVERLRQLAVEAKASGGDVGICHLSPDDADHFTATKPDVVSAVIDRLLSTVSGARDAALEEAAQHHARMAALAKEKGSDRDYAYHLTSAEIIRALKSAAPQEPT